MELRLLRTFQAVAEHAHFGRAARALHLSQPALSKQIVQLEEEVGAPVFDRGRHGARLTPLGEALLADVVPLLRHADGVLDRARRAARGETGALRLGFGVATRVLVPRLVSRFRRAHPLVAVSLGDMSSHDQIEALERGELDVGFVRLPVQRPLNILPVVEDRLVLATPASRAPELARRPRQELAEEPFVEIVPSHSSGLHAHALRVCARYGFRPRVVQSASELFTVLSLVAAGMGLAVVPASVRTTRLEGIAYLPLDVPEAAWRVGAAWVSGGRQPVRDAFLAILREHIARQER
ncbi:MAG TPA: LysR substrate-binding domain-containing protein [Anaeromyxobacteraceae bacterium]|nr:LysR substrate-binding domain-containing protein [Anaeromyxobacteraceae bacterium]